MASSYGAKVSAPGFYRPELDCLRFFAFFAVFIHHTLNGQASYYAARHIPFGTLIASAASAGRFGVDLFFLLSAYLITELLVREHEQSGKIDLRSFYVRRILRIWPLYFMSLLGGSLLSLLDSSQYFPPKYAVAFALMGGNWLLFFGVRIQSVMVPLWSVSFEEQFYLLWPALLSTVRRRQALLYASGILLLAGTLGRLVLFRYASAAHDEFAIFSNTFTRLDPLALGIFTAVISRKKDLAFGWMGRLGLLAAGCGVWLAAGHFFRLSRSFMLIGYPAMALGAWLIFMSVLGSSVAPRWLRYLGKISYGLYVFHMFALYLVIRLRGDYPHTLGSFLVYWCFGLALTIAMAALSYRFFESPFLRLKERFAHVKSRPV